MEFEGCRRSLTKLIGQKIPVRGLTTDRHVTITARMKSDFPQIIHQYDVWHLSKSVTKKLTKKVRKSAMKNYYHGFSPFQTIFGGVLQHAMGIFLR